VLVFLKDILVFMCLDTVGNFCFISEIGEGGPFVVLWVIFFRVGVCCVMVSLLF
jgi:hypothetical protein